MLARGGGSCHRILRVILRPIVRLVGNPAVIYQHSINGTIHINTLKNYRPSSYEPHKNPLSEDSRENNQVSSGYAVAGKHRNTCLAVIRTTCSVYTRGESCFSTPSRGSDYYTPPPVQPRDMVSVLWNSHSRRTNLAGAIVSVCFSGWAIVAVCGTLARDVESCGRSFVTTQY